MKNIINLNTGEMSRVEDDKAWRLVDNKNYEYVSKSEIKNKPEYMKGNMTPWIPVKSSNIAEIQYFKDTKVMRIKFGVPRVSGMYEYQNVPEELFHGILASESKGSYFWKWIRPFPKMYPYKRVY